MRHRKKGNHLGRTASHKKALMRNLAAEVFEHKEIRTTLAKAKELRSYVERLITYGKKGTLHHRRLAFQFLQNKQAVKTLFDEIAPVYEDRAGGYTRIIKLGNRKGDNAPVSIFQLVGFEKIKPKSEKKKKKEEEKAKPKVEEETTQTVVETENTSEVQEEQAAPEPKEVEAKVEEAQEEEPKAEASEEVKPEAEAKEEKAEEAKEDQKAEEGSEETKKE